MIRNFPDIARAEAVRLDELRLVAWQERIGEQLRAGGGAELVPELEALAAAHPLHEPLAGLLIRALAAAGHPGRALGVFAEIRARLAETLGAGPSPELAALHVELLRGESRAVKGNLPAELSSFVGREDDLVAVRRLVGAHRLVTLIGPGGSGKTRLSVEAGPALAAGLPDGVWRVELAPLTDPGELPQAILTSLRQRGQMLFSRAGMGPAGVAVEPLALPSGDEDPARFPAVRLLVDRAAAARPGSALDGRSTGPVVRICRALDGMPLAIELAAARLRTLPVEVLADR